MNLLYMFLRRIYIGTVAGLLLFGVVCSVLQYGRGTLLPYSKVVCPVCVSHSFWRQSVLAVLNRSVKATIFSRPDLLRQSRPRPHCCRLTVRAYNPCLFDAVGQPKKRPLKARVSFDRFPFENLSVPTFRTIDGSPCRLNGPLPMHVVSATFSGQRVLPFVCSRVRSLIQSRIQKERIFSLPSASGESLSRLPYRGAVSRLFIWAAPSHHHCHLSTMSHLTSDSCCTSTTQEGAEKKMDIAIETKRQPIPLYGGGGGRVRIAALLSDEYAPKCIGQLLTVCGWSRSVRKQGGGSLCFVVLSDGSGPGSLQVVVDSSIGENFAQLLKCGAGCSFRATGEVVKSPAKGQALELSVRDPQKGHRLEILGMTDASKYPLAKKEHTREYLREIAHLRPRSHLMGAVTRVRSHLAMATHRFFQDRGFLYIHTPIITASDCEGAGEMFQVTTILPAAVPTADSEKREDGAVSEKATGNAGTIAAKLPPTTPTGEVDYSKDFFGRRAFLTVSGQLNVEPYCCALGDVYTFGPTFRAENSHTSRHLAEFWMVEPELAFATLEDNMAVAEEYVKYCVRWVLANCRADIEWFEKNQEQGLIERLDSLLAEPFTRVTYTDAIELLKAAAPKANFKETVSWGMDLGSEHERYLTEQIFKKPCIVHDYPKEIKAFYMKLNKDGKTVRAMDVLVPKIGELIGGSQREDNLQLLDKMIIAKGLDPKDYWWYRELRSYGTVPHCGFGLGFERLVMLVTGIENIRDTVAYPRYPGHADY